MGALYQHQRMQVEGSTVVITLRNGQVERHDFTTPAEAAGRMEVVAEALSWIGTPFVDCADVKGPKGAVDCAMLLVRTFVDTGFAPPFDPRPYSPRLMLHSDKQEFIGQITSLGGFEVEKAVLGDIVVWQFGRSYSHGGVLANSGEVMHAYSADGMATVSSLDSPLLREITRGLARPVKYFDVGGRKWQA